MRKSRIVRTLSLLLFALGVLLGLTVMGIGVWGDLEATLFNPGVRADATLSSLRCPVMITPDETATIRARVKNTLDHATNFFVRARISEGFVTLMREEKFSLSLEPGEAQWVEWAVSADDAAYDRLVLFKVTISGGYPLPSREATCGVVVIGIPFLTGNKIYGISIGIALVATIGGLALWIFSNPHRLDATVQVTRAMIFLSIATLAGMVVTLAGWWVLGGLALIVVLLTIGVIIGYLVSRSV